MSTKKTKRRVVTAKEISLRKGVPTENIGAVSQALQIEGTTLEDVIVTGHPTAVTCGKTNNGIVEVVVKSSFLNHLFQKNLEEILKDGKSKMYLLLETEMGNLKEEVRIGVDNSTGDGIYYILDPKAPKSRIYDHINVVKINDNAEETDE